MDTPPVQVSGAGEKVTTVPEVLDQVEQVISRVQLAAAVETVLELLPLPSAEDDDDLDWRVELAGRYGTVRPFADMLASVIPWGATAAGSLVVAAVKALPKLMAARRPGVEHIREGVDGTFIWTPSMMNGHALSPPLSFMAAVPVGPEPRSLAGGRLELLETATTVTEVTGCRATAAPDPPIWSAT